MEDLVTDDEVALDVEVCSVDGDDTFGVLELAPLMADVFRVDEGDGVPEVLSVEDTGVTELWTFTELDGMPELLMLEETAEVIELLMLDETADDVAELRTLDEAEGVTEVLMLEEAADDVTELPTLEEAEGLTEVFTLEETEEVTELCVRERVDDVTLEGEDNAELKERDRVDDENTELVVELDSGFDEESAEESAGMCV